MLKGLVAVRVRSVIAEKLPGFNIENLSGLGRFSVYIMKGEKTDAQQDPGSPI